MPPGFLIAVWLARARREFFIRVIITLPSLRAGKHHPGTEGARQPLSAAQEVCSAAPPNPAISRNHLRGPQCHPASRVTFYLDHGGLEDILPSVQSPLTRKSRAFDTLGPCVGYYVQRLQVQC